MDVRTAFSRIPSAFPVFQRVALSEGLLSIHSGGTAPDFHRLPSIAQPEFELRSLQCVLVVKHR